jgi:hypothetical protein
VDRLVLFSLIFFAAALLAGLAVSGWRGFVAWRALRRYQRTTAVSMLQAATLVSQLERRTAAVADRAALVGTARAQLEESLAGAKVIAGGARELLTMIRLVRGFMPTK